MPIDRMRDNNIFHDVCERFCLMFPFPFSHTHQGELEWPVNMADFPPAAKDLIEKILVIDPKKRLGAAAYQPLKDHAFFAVGKVRMRRGFTF